MIIFVFTGSKNDTHAQVLSWPEVRAQIQTWSYTRLFSHAQLPVATYIFGDFDRLSAWELELAARVFRKLREGGARVLNDPGRVKQRHALLRGLNATGLNSFQVWLLETEGLPDRYPVFLRTASGHRGAESALFHSPEEVRQAAERLVASGIPSKEILAVEFAAEMTGAVYRKHAAHRVGERIITSLCVHDSRWMAKTGQKGIAGDRLYAEERAMIQENRFAEDLMPIFKLAEIDYGRVDFGIVKGRIETYEINTNPTMKKLSDHPSPYRIASDQLWIECYAEALEALDSHPHGNVSMDDSVFVRQRRKDSKMVNDRFVV